MTPVSKQPDPDASIPERREQFGLAALHKRFVRRAEHLATLPAFREAIKTARKTWNDAYPRYAVWLGNELSDCGLPQRLAADAANELAAFMQLGVESRTCRLQGEPVPLALPERSLAHMDAPELEARIRWNSLIDELAHRFWPARSFPTPGGSEHPATRFVRACLVSDLLMIQPADWFTQPRLDIVTLPNPVNGATWCIPIYPGMTADDLRTAAERLARQAEQAYAFEVPADIVRHLHDDGLSVREVADELGIAESTVRAILSP